MCKVLSSCVLFSNFFFFKTNVSVNFSQFFVALRCIATKFDWNPSPCLTDKEGTINQYYSFNDELLCRPVAPSTVKSSF